ncbi:phosphoenolpyruvate synthase [Patescibacteria group bacterium]|nr:phosphoenolpyruvate synthase [Patescibacteria group bacterium]
MSAQPLILFLKDIQKNDVEIVGGKSANLGEMYNVGLPVPDAFATTVYAYDLFFKENQLDKFIYPLLKNLNYENTKELENVSKQIYSKIRKGRIPHSIKNDVFKAYKKLSGRFKHSFTAVRSSATAEDSPGASFAGQQVTFLNIKGEANILEKVRECWASLFTPRSIYYRNINKIEHSKVKISVVVQKMIQSDVSGVMFSIDPVTNEKDRIIIEAVWGLGEMIVQGSVIPDKYVVQKETFYILSKEVNTQEVQLIKTSSGQTKEEKVPNKIIDSPKLNEKEIVELAKYADLLQKHYFFPQDAEWAREKGKLYIVQTRPVTTIGNKSKEINIQKDGESFKISPTPILSGSPASPGIGTGPVKIIITSKEISKIEPGDILVSTMTSPDFVPAMKRASAIVTDQGGQTSHAAIVSRELGIPCVVGTKTATEVLKNNQVVSVNGVTGEVFMGILKNTKSVVKEKKTSQTKTATKLYVNLGEPDLAKEIAKKPVDGVGLLRAEFMIANFGIHPKEAIKQKKQKEFINDLTKGITKICDAFNPRPVIYRATDFKTNEYSALKGGKNWEPIESNPMLGFRGAFRYVVSPEVFSLELQAIKKVREKYSNLWLMAPFVRSPEELSKVRRIVATEGLFEDKTFKFWMMVELPTNVILLEDFIKVGIDGISIGSNDLTMLILGTDRDNSEVASAFDERSPAVLWAIKKVIKTCNKNGITSSICGQAPSIYEEYTDMLVNAGITSISVNPDAISRTKDLIISAEKKIIS